LNLATRFSLGLRWNASGINLAPNQLSFPSGLCVTSLGTLFITDSGNHRVQRLRANANSTSTVAGSVGGSSGTSASLMDTPIAITVDAGENAYVVDMFNHRVQFWANTSSSATTIAGTGKHRLDLKLTSSSFRSD
jgi:DNA-binding beta-propeller fold protein YncE